MHSISWTDRIGAFAASARQIRISDPITFLGSGKAGHYARSLDRAGLNSFRHLLDLLPHAQKVAAPEF